MSSRLSQISQRIIDVALTHSWAILLLTVATIFVALLVLSIQRILLKRMAAVEDGKSIIIASVIRGLAQSTTTWFIWIISFYVVEVVVDFLTDQLQPTLDKVALLALFIQAALWGSALISIWIARAISRAQFEDRLAHTTAFSAMSFVAKAAVWIIVTLLALENLGFDVTTLVAGFGIGGIALALAVQNILGDLLCSLSILLDKPFEVGDFIIIGDKSGTVERIGVKSTRVRSLRGEQLIVANSDLLSSRIENFKRMNERRILFAVGVTYDTSEEKLKLASTIIREAIESTKNTRYDRAHFHNFGAFSLDYEIVYYVLSRDYNVYMDTQQEICLKIVKRFREEGIEFAFPTQTLYVSKVDGDSTAAA